MARFQSSRASRSDKYQYLLLEISTSYEVMSLFSNNKSIESSLNPFMYNEDILDLQDKLKVKFWKIAEETLTDRQLGVMIMVSDGYTQSEIANFLGVNQSSINKCILGAQSYLPGKIISYGGFHKKMRKAVLDDPEIKMLLDEISELKEERF